MTAERDIDAAGSGWLDELVGSLRLIGSTVEAPRRDLCRPHGIRFDRSLCPPDDELQDEICRVAGAFDSAAAAIAGWAGASACFSSSLFAAGVAGAVAAEEAAARRLVASQFSAAEPLSLPEGSVCPLTGSAADLSRSIRPTDKEL